jgi:hypothetical protein
VADRKRASTGFPIRTKRNSPSTSGKAEHAPALTGTYRGHRANLAPRARRLYIRDVYLDIRPQFSYISPRISLTEGRIPDAIRNVERVRCFRAGSQPAPERLWASFSSALRPKREVLSLELGLERAGNARPARSQEAWPEAEPGCESPGESRSGAPEGERAPTLARVRAPASAGGNACRCGADLGWMRLSARRFPRFFSGRRTFWHWRRGWQSSGAFAPRERYFIVVIASRRVRPEVGGPMTSSTKQSRFAAPPGLLRRGAPRNDETAARTGCRTGHKARRMIRR